MIYRATSTIVNFSPPGRLPATGLSFGQGDYELLPAGTLVEKLERAPGARGHSCWIWVALEGPLKGWTAPVTDCYFDLVCPLIELARAGHG